MKEYKISINEIEYKTLMEVLLKTETDVRKGYILGGFLQKLVNKFEAKKEVEKDGKNKA